jgi:hypothetical protein
MIGDHHPQDGRETTLLVRAMDDIFGTHKSMNPRVKPTQFPGSEPRPQTAPPYCPRSWRFTASMKPPVHLPSHARRDLVANAITVSQEAPASGIHQYADYLSANCEPCPTRGVMIRWEGTNDSAIGTRAHPGFGGNGRNAADASLKSLARRRLLSLWLCSVDACTDRSQSGLLEA